MIRLELYLTTYLKQDVFHKAIIQKCLANILSLCSCKSDYVSAVTNSLS